MLSFTLVAGCSLIEGSSGPEVVEVEAAPVPAVDVGAAAEAAAVADAVVADEGNDPAVIVPVAPGALPADWVWARPTEGGCELGVLHAPDLGVTPLASLPACPVALVLVPGAPRFLVTYDGAELPGYLLSFGKGAPEPLPTLPVIGPSGIDWSRHGVSLTREGGVVVDARWGVHAGMDCEGPCEAQTGEGRWRLVGGAWTAEPPSSSASGATELQPGSSVPAAGLLASGARLDAILRAAPGVAADASWQQHRDVDGSIPPLAWPSIGAGEGDLPTGPVLVEVGDAWRALAGTSALLELRLFPLGNWVAVGDSRVTTLFDLRNLGAVWSGEGILWPWPRSMGRAPT